MVGRDTTNPEPGLANVTALPFFERLAQPAEAAELVAAIEAWTKPGEIVLDLNGRGGWVARAAIAEQRRAADFETWPLTRLLADVVLRPPDLRQIEKSVAGIANMPMAGSTLRKTIEAPYASVCPRCGKPVVLESMVWQPIATPVGGAPVQPKKRGKRAGGEAAAGSAGSGHGLISDWSYRPDESLRAIAREYKCAQCHEQVGGAELRSADPTHADLRLAESVLAGGEVREAMRKRFPAPRPTHPLVDQLIDLHTPRQLLGLHAILTRIDAEERTGAMTAALRLAFLHAVILASRLNVSHGKPSPVRIVNGVLKVPAVHEWREINPWQAFEGGLTIVRGFAGRLEAAMPRSAYARPGVDMAALEGTTANVTIGEATHSSLRKLGLHGERMSHAPSPSRVKLMLGQEPLRWTSDRLAASYHGTGWIFGAAAVSLLPYDSLYKPPVKQTAAEDAVELARGVARTLAIATPALSQTGRAVILLDDDEPATLVAAALGGAAAGCRLIEARLRRGGEHSAGMVVFVPATGVMAPGPRTRANRPLPPVEGGAGDPGTIRGPGVFAGPQKVDEGVFRASVAAQMITETVVDLLKARGEPAPFELLLGDLLIGLDKSGQLARLARILRPERAGDGWSAWVEAGGVGSAAPLAGAGASSVRAGASPRDRSVATPAVADLTPGAPPSGSIVPQVKDEEPATDPVAQLIEIIHEEIDRPNNRRIRQIEPGQYWLASEEDRGVAAQPLADRVEWAVFSLLSSAGHLTERGAIDRTTAMFKDGELPDVALIEACLASYLSPNSIPDDVAGFEQLEARSADHDRMIGVLADIGHKLGMQVWIGRRQQTRRVDGKPLAAWLDESEREAHLPLITWAPEGELDRVDCAWYVRRRATFLFEVEWTAMMGEPVLVRHARYAADEKCVRFLVVPPERAELIKFKLARSPLLRKSIEDRNWHFIKWNHLADYAALPDATLADMEPYLGLDAVADTVGEQLPLFEG
ncbi:MAG TPA: hypothetical protein VF337_01900 [Candidatus Limnocylindrales bacterium]